MFLSLWVLRIVLCFFLYGFWGLLCVFFSLWVLRILGIALCVFFSMGSEDCFCVFFSMGSEDYFVCFCLYGF